MRKLPKNADELIDPAGAVQSQIDPAVYLGLPMLELVQKLGGSIERLDAFLNMRAPRWVVEKEIALASRYITTIRARLPEFVGLVDRINCGRRLSKLECSRQIPHICLVIWRGTR